MVEGNEPPWGPISAISEKELQVLSEYRNTILKSGRSAQASLLPVLRFYLSENLMAVDSTCVWITKG